MTSLHETSLLEHTCEECPVCLETPTQEMMSSHPGNGFMTIGGCGHNICWGCHEKISRTPSQYKTLPGFNNKRFIKCPMCRSFDKPSYEELERQLLHYYNANDSGSLVHSYRALQTRYRYLFREHHRVLNDARAIGLNFRYQAPPVPAAPTPLPAAPTPAPAPSTRRLSCTGLNCQTTSLTARRCPMHRQTPCCRRCNCCNVCQQASRPAVDNSSA